jgi:cyclophilin family peptidyl-prolyl cis-trans isomerase
VWRREGVVRAPRANDRPAGRAVFGKVTKGMDVVHNIERVRTHPTSNRPYEEIKILNIELTYG